MFINFGKTSQGYGYLQATVIRETRVSQYFVSWKFRYNCYEFSRYHWIKMNYPIATIVLSGSYFGFDYVKDKKENPEKNPDFFGSF